MSKQFLYPGRLSPLAIIVQAEVPDNAPATDKENLHLTGLKEEAETIAEHLHGAGYDVHLLSTGYYSELAALLSDADICERLVIFHYCGHANGKSVDMYLDNGQRLPVSAEGLAEQMATKSKALRLVYMNACLTKTQEDDFRAQLPQVNFIGTKLELEDWYAKKLALSIYDRLAGNADARGQTTIGDALTRAIGEDRGYNPIRIGAAMQITVGETSGDIAALPDLNFKLAEGKGLVSDYLIKFRQKREPAVILAYALAIVVLQAAFLWCSHVWTATSSPAFQAAFVYPPTCENLQHMVAGADRFFPKGVDAVADEATGAPTASQQLMTLLRGPELACPVNTAFKLGHTSDLYGFWVEWVRVGLLCIVMVIMWTMIYRLVPRDYPILHLHRLNEVRSQFWLWRSLEWNRAFVWLFIIGLVSVGLYHLWPAHVTLADLDLDADPLEGITWMQARWAFYINDGSIWEGYAGATTLGELAAFQESAKTTWEDVIRFFIKFSYGDIGYFALYQRPYLFYMGYSITNYLLVALPMLVIVVNSFRFTRKHMRLRLDGLRVGLRMSIDGYFETGDYIKRRLVSIRREIISDFDRFVWLFGLLVAFFVYEVWIGRTTTALFAQILMVLVFLLVVFGLATVMSVWNSYRDQLKEIRIALEDIIDDTQVARLSGFQSELDKAFTPIRATSVVIFAVLLVIAVYFSVHLMNRHWTPFTHDFLTPF